MKARAQGLRFQLPAGWTSPIRHLLSRDAERAHLAIEEALVPVPDLEKTPPPEELGPHPELPEATPPADILRAMMLGQVFYLDDARQCEEQAMLSGSESTAYGLENKILRGPRAVGYQQQYPLGDKKRPVRTEAITVVSGPRLIRIVARGRDVEGFEAAQQDARRIFRSLRFRKTSPPPPQVLDEDDQYEQERTEEVLRAALTATPEADAGLEPPDPAVQIYPLPGESEVDDELAPLDRSGEALERLADLDVNEEGRLVTAEGQIVDQLERFLAVTEPPPATSLDEAPPEPPEEEGPEQRNLDRFLRRSTDKP